MRFFARDQTLLTVLVRVSLQAIYAFGLLNKLIQTASTKYFFFILQNACF